LLKNGRGFSTAKSLLTVERPRVYYLELEGPKVYYIKKDELLSIPELDFDLIITGNRTAEVLGNEVAKVYGAEILSLKPDERDFWHLNDLDLKPKSIAAVGGGSISDYAKVLADVTGAKLTIIPTALSNDGYASDRSSLRNNGIKGTYKTRGPDVIIGIKEVLEDSCVDCLNIGGWGDHLSKYSSLSDWKLAAKKGKEKFDQKIFSEVEASLDFPGNTKDLFYHIINSGKVAQRFGSSRPLSGGEHAIYHALSNSRNYEKEHGRQVAAFGLFVLGAYELAGLEPIIKWQDYQNKMKALGLPMTLKGLEVNYSEFEAAVMKAPTARKKERYGVLDYMKAQGVLTPTYIRSVSETVGLI